MQRKTLLYVFGIAALAGLVLGIGFFGGELRKKIAEDPGRNQFELSSVQGILPDLSDIKKKDASQDGTISSKTPAVPKPAAPPAAEPAKVPEEKEDSFSFAILGDTPKFDPDSKNGGLQSAVENIKKKNVGLIMTTGDLLEECDGGDKCEKGLNGWKSALGELFSKTYAVMGNQDRKGEEKSDDLWRKFFDLPQNGPDGYGELTYSFDFQNSHFVVLNSEKPDDHKINKTQRDWLEEDLEENKKDNTFVFFHEPAFPVSERVGSSLDKNTKDRDALWEILKSRKITAVFSGYEHIVSRKKEDGIYQYILGNTDASDDDLPAEGAAEYSYRGKSYGIVEVSGKEVTVNVHSVEGNLLDSFKLPVQTPQS